VSILTPNPGENKSFTDKVIRFCQKHSLYSKTKNGAGCRVNTEYLLRMNRLFYCPQQDLFWIQKSDGTFEVAVWLIDLNDKFVNKCLDECRTYLNE
jgi:hypothetical protein